WDSFHGLVGCKKGIKAAGIGLMKKYLQYFGYLNDSYRDFSDEFDENLDAAVRDYQLNFNLGVTGELDESTVDLMAQPRCGNLDVINGTSTMASGKSSDTFRGIRNVGRHSFFPNRPRWPPGRDRLTYAFLPENRLPAPTRSAFARAFRRWSAVTPLSFVETEAFEGADIRIAFFRGDHGDGEPFDGLLGTLAHAFSPPSGRFHLDGDENWVVDGDFLDATRTSAVDLESVAVHEIGHLLGLGHSSVREAIMYPTIAFGTRKVDLVDDDIAGIQELYGPNPNKLRSGPEPNPNHPSDPSPSASLSVHSFWTHIV
ncbi:matrixin family protein, partial [Genlisea aurea]